MNHFLGRSSLFRASFNLTLLLAMTPAGVARADLRAALLEELATPVIRLTLGSLPVGRTLAQRMIGESVILNPAKPDIWRSQSEQMVKNLIEKQAAGTADEVYLRLLRLNSRFRAEALKTSNLVDGSGPVTTLSVEDIELARKLAAEELALREPTFLERVRGVSADLGGKLEFVSSQKSLGQRGSGNFVSTRQEFLRGSGGDPIGKTSAFDRSVEALRELTRGREASYLIFQTDEGRELMELVYGPEPRLFSGVDPAQEFVETLAVDSKHREVVIQLAYRLSQTMEAYELLDAKLALSEHRSVRQEVLRGLARRFLSLSTSSSPGAVVFTPVSR